MKIISFLKLLLIITVLIITTNCSKDDNDEENCPQITDASFSVYPSAIHVSFSTIENINTYRIEYGLTGFEYGQGETITTSQSSILIDNLLPNTTYDVYFTSICSPTEESKPYLLQSLTTDPTRCTGQVDAYIYQNSINSLKIDPSYTGDYLDGFELEYGPVGFSLGNGKNIVNQYSSDNFYLIDLEQETTYDIYIRPICNYNDYGRYKKFTHTVTESCSKPYNLRANFTGGSCSYSDGYRTFRFSWDNQSYNTENYTVSFTTENGNPDNGTQFETSTTDISISGISCSTSLDYFYVRANCENALYSEWAGPLKYD